MGCCQETSEGTMRGKKRLMDGTGKVNVWHERERYWDRRVHGGWGGEEDRGEMGDRWDCAIPVFPFTFFSAAKLS